MMRVTGYGLRAMGNNIYVIGHKSPDLDSVAAAISYADLKNRLAGGENYEPAVAGECNRETAYALDKFAIAKPAMITAAADKSFILVDHNESAQSVDGMGDAKIVELLDHHKLDFKYAEPIKVTIEPWGSSCSIIYDLYKRNNIEPDGKLAGLMLSAVLIDTVITKSPTCTDKDKEIISELSKLAGIGDWQAYGMELFKIRSSVAELSPAEIIKSDFKDFEFKAGKFGIGQMETADLGEIKPREDELLETMNDMRNKLGYHSVILFLTDIINVGSQFLVATADQAKVEEALGAKLENSRVYLPGIISRKKQVAPKFTEVFDK